MTAIYLDHAATTPVRSEVREAMAPYLADTFGNPSSAHRWGRRAAAALEAARERCAEALGARPPEIFFVRGGTESDNLAVLGRARAARAAGERPRVAVSAVEHSAVLESAEAVEAEGGARTMVGVDAAGRPRDDELRRVLAWAPHVLSVMWVNNETGTVLPIADVAEASAAAGVAFHTDAVQAVGKVEVRVDRVPVDLLTVTGHKIYGPKGSALLYVREGTDVRPGLHGGGQERGLRPGTEDVAGAVGLAEALSLVVAERQRESARLGTLRDLLEAALVERVPDLRVHGAEGERAPHVLNVGIPGVDGSTLVPALDLEGLAVSSGSACHSGAARASHVLSALYGPDASAASLRFSFGKLNTRRDVARAAEVTVRVVERLTEAAQVEP